MSIRQNQRGFHLIPVLLLVVVLGVVAFAGLKVFKKDASNNTAKNTGGNSAFLQQYKHTCKERDVAFTSAPMKIDQLALIRPLGAVNDGHVTPTDHVYLGAGNEQAGPNDYPVLMPADGTVVDVAAMPAQYIGDRADAKTAPEDHRMVISHSCRYFTIYIHLHKLSDKVRAVVGKLQPNQSKQVALELKAGDVVGYVGKETFDWTSVDTSKTLPGFITPSLYEGESWKIHTVSPFDLYSGSLKSQLEAKSLRRVAPLGGKIDYDQPGKLIGNWFREGGGGYSGKQGNNGGRYWDSHLSVAPDYIDPVQTIVSMGNWNGAAKQLLVKGSVDPAAVASGDEPVKYELLSLSYFSPSQPGWRGNSFAADVKPSQDSRLEGTIMFQVLDGEKLKVEKFPGKSANQVGGFTAAAEIFER